MIKENRIILTLLRLRDSITLEQGIENGFLSRKEIQKLSSKVNKEERHLQKEDLIIKGAHIIIGRL